MSLHENELGNSNHPVTANPNSAGTGYADLSARDADSSFNTAAENVNKVVRVDSPLSYYILTSVSPTWLEITSVFSGNDATEVFTSTDDRFFGELGLPGTQSWTDTEVNTGTIVVFADTVFGDPKDVIKYNIAASGDTTKSEIALTAQNWTDILTFGASYSGVCRITEDVSSQSIFSGMGFSSGNDPRPSSIQSRVGVSISENGTHTTITLDGQAAVVLDGTGGNPLVLKDDYFSWEVFIDPTPDAGVNFGAANLSVNEILVKVGGIVSSDSTVNDEVSVANSSPTGTTTFYFSNFGVTIYEEVSTRTLTPTTMSSDRAQIFIPGGARDYTVILPDGNPRKIGNTLDFIVQNIGGKLKVQTQNPSSPKSLFNGLNEIEKNIISAKEITFVNTLANGNVYVENSEILNQDALGSAPGSINYDPVKGTMNVRNVFPGSSVQVGQESVVFVVNNTGSAITDGVMVHVSGYDASNDAMEIEMALADKVEDTEVMGMTTTSMIDGAVGLVTVFGRVNDLDTSSFSVGDLLYLSETVPGGVTTARPSIPIQIGHVGKVNASTGFVQVEIKDLERSIFGGFSHTLDQTFTAGVSAPVQFNKNEEFSGLEHSETVNNDEFTFTSGGVYQVTAEPQYTRVSGGGTDVLNMFIAKDSGSGFVNMPDSTVKFAVNTTGITTVSPLTTTFRVSATDKIRVMVQVETANLILEAFPASGSDPNDIPLTPSIIMNIVRIGD